MLKRANGRSAAGTVPACCDMAGALVIYIRESILSVAYISCRNIAVDF